MAIFHEGHALLVGVGADLPVTVADAASLRDVLIDPKRAAYSRDQVRLLAEKTATRQLILNALDDLASRLKQQEPATAIVYYSGHGGRVQNPGLDKPEYFLVPYGYDPGNFEQTAISGAEFTAKIEALQANKLLVILDCCHAGGVPALKAPGAVFTKSPVPPQLISTLEKGSGHVVIGSSQEQEYSYAGNPNSVFTACLMEALAGKGSVRRDGYARVLDVLSYLFDQVPQRAPGPQHPYLNKVVGLDSNFAICYYAGGQKSVPGSPSAATTQDSPTLTTLARSRLEQKRDGLTGAYNILARKLKMLREDLAAQAGGAMKFQLQHEVLRAEAEMEQIEAQIEEIEARLNA